MSKMNSPLQSIVFIAGGLLYGLFTYASLMMAVWGAPTHPIQYIALVCSLGLILSGLIALGLPEKGRWLAISCTLGVGFLFIPATQALVPSAHAIIPQILYLEVLGYFFLLAFCLFYPKKLAFSIPVVGVCILTALSFAAHTLVLRVLDGEYRRPMFVFFNLIESETPLHISNNRRDEGLSDKMITTLSAKGFSGSLEWQGEVWENKKNRPKMIIISTGQIPENKDFHYPKGDFVIYVFNGKEWITVPEDVELYPSFVTLDKDGMLQEKFAEGGIAGSRAFNWNSR